MHINYLALGIPFMLLIIYLEYILAKKRKLMTVFRYESTVVNLSIGIADRFFDIFCSTIFYTTYYFLYEHWHFFEIGDAWYIWALLLLATDLVWYWYHRLGHKINILWAAHIVHHHSEEFNYTSAVRITVFQAFIRSAFWSVLPLIGFQPKMVIPVLMFHGVYSFFTHTRLVGKLGLLEYVFITPSLHRVHHASDEKYLDKNFGDIFVFWDKLFGTFMAEEEEPHYGIVHGLETSSFLWQHFHYYLEIVVAFQRAKNWKDKWRAAFGGPNEMNPAIRRLLERKFKVMKVSSATNLMIRKYINMQMVGCVLVLMMVMFFYSDLSFVVYLLSLAFVLVTLVVCGALLDGRNYVLVLEGLRFGLLIPWLLYMLIGSWWISICSAFAGLFTIFLFYKHFVMREMKMSLF